MFTRILNLMGIELGEPLLPAGEANKFGYWENQYFLDIDMKALAYLDCHPHGFAPRERLLEISEASKTLRAPAALSEHIERYIESNFTSGIWGWKDPRTVLLMPFWTRLLRSLGYERLRPMIIVRAPGPCVRSMSKTGYVEQAAQLYGVTVTELSLDVWKAYNTILAEIQLSTGCYIGIYDWFLNKSTAAAEIDRCTNYLELRDVPKQQILDWINSGNSRYEQDSAMSDPLADQMYEQLVRQVERVRQ